MINLDGNSYTATEIPQHVKVGKYSSIASDVKFHNPNDNHLCISNKKCVYTINWDQPDSKKDIVIGNDVWICDGVRVLQDTIIGDGCIIGAGAVISGQIPPYSVVVGNPGKITRTRFTEDQIAKLDKIKWWNWPESTVMERKGEMKDIDTFLEIYA